MWQSPPPVVGNATSIFGGAPEDVAHGVGGAGVTGVVRPAGSGGTARSSGIRKRRFMSRHVRSVSRSWLCAGYPAWRRDRGWRGCLICGHGLGCGGPSGSGVAGRAGGCGADLDPDKISYTPTLRIIRRSATGTAASLAGVRPGRGRGPPPLPGRSVWQRRTWPRRRRWLDARPAAPSLPRPCPDGPRAEPW